MIKQNEDVENHTYASISMPNYIQGYKIEREFGNKPIKECVKEVVSLHINK